MPVHTSYSQGQEKIGIIRVKNWRQGKVLGFSPDGKLKSKPSGTSYVRLKKSSKTRLSQTSLRVILRAYYKYGVCYLSGYYMGGKIPTYYSKCKDRGCMNINTCLLYTSDAADE